MCWLRTKLYDKRDDINFPIVNFPFTCSNIPAAPAYGVYISHLLLHFRACGFYHDFLHRGLLLTRKLLKKGFLVVNWSHHFERFTEYLCHKWTRICSVCYNHKHVLLSFMTYHRVCNQSNTMGAISGAWTVYPSRVPQFIPRCLCSLCCSIFSFLRSVL